MAKNKLFESLCDPAIMKIGWHLAHGDSRDDFATDVFGYADHAFGLDKRLSFIIEQVKENRYSARPLIEIDVPKSGLSVRPGNVLPLEEAVILHAIVYLIAPSLDGQLAENVYSYRLSENWKKRAKKGRSLFKEGDADEIPFLKTRTIRNIKLDDAWYVHWPEFEKESQRSVTELGFSHLTKTDIAGYFENIDLGILEAILREIISGEERLIQILMALLNSWTRHTAYGLPIGRGIPQGNEVSSFLGNIYLRPLDDQLTYFCEKHDAKWLRYVDDVKVFTKSYDDARAAVFLINNALRGMHLSLQGQKTEILSGQDLEHELFDPEIEQINAAIENLKGLDIRKEAKDITQILTQTRDVTRQFTTKLPNSVTQLTGKKSRLFRRCLTLYGMARRPQFRKPALEALSRLPELRVLQSTLRYLMRQSYAHHDEIVEGLLQLLEESALPFPYQTAAVYDALRYLHPKTSATVASRIRRQGLKSHPDWYVRQKAAEAIFTFPYREGYITPLAAKALQDEHPWVRRAGVLLFLRTPVQIARDTIEASVYHPDPEVSRIALLCKRNLEDSETSLKTIKRLRTGRDDDQNFINQLGYFYLLRCSPKPHVVEEIAQIVTNYSKSRSEKVKWHIRHLGEMMAWV